MKAVLELVGGRFPVRVERRFQGRAVGVDVRCGERLNLEDECRDDDPVDADVFPMFVFRRKAVVIGRAGRQAESVPLTSVLSALKFDAGGLAAGSGEQGTLFGYDEGFGLFV